MVELRPLGVRCNIQCQYCYQNPQRDAGNFTGDYNLDRMKAAITAEGGPFSIFGGEPLLVPKRDLEELWSWGLAQFGGNTIQTNGTLITDDHVRLFKKYNVRVGISLDGPGELNDVRWHGNLEQTREATAKSERAIRVLCQEGMAPSLIVTLHRGNASPERLPTLYGWVRDLDAMGVWFVGLHLLESESAVVRARYALSTEENIAALLGFLELEKSLRLSFDLFPDMRRLLVGEDRGAACVWSACDPYTTAAVRGVEGQGQRSNCGRTNKDGIDFGKGNTPGYERYVALYQTPQEFGGCAGCRFFLMCKGQCPGTAIDGDWRNRTEHCEVWKAVYSRLESDLAAEGRQTLSLSPRRKAVERDFVKAWSQGKVTFMADATWKIADQGSGGDLFEGAAGFAEEPFDAAKERLPFLLPEFNRRSWVTEHAKSVWEPRIERIWRAWRDIEWLAVDAGIRECALIWISPDELPELIPRWEGARLSAIELKMPEPPAATCGRICIVVGALDRIEQLRDAWAACDNETIGTLLGYPPCCRAFFSDVWVRQRCIDTTWGMIENAPPDGSIRRADGVITIELPTGIPPFANILWRWLGVRAAPHLPCRFDCSASIAFGKRMLEVGAASGYAEEVEWIAEILAWPVEWSALHGIAEIKSPLMKISTQTDATAGKRVIRWVGTTRPAEGAVGLHFPFLPPEKPLLTLSREYQRGLTHAALNETEPPWRYSDNGFTSADAMNRLHRPIVEMAREALSGRSGNVLDLGCGNGMLLAKICEGRTDLKPFGVDCNRSALENARQVLPDFGGRFAHGDFFDLDLWGRGPNQYALALFMPGRLLDAPPDRAARVLDRLRYSCSRVLLYAYPDWADEIDSLARRLGLQLETPNRGTAAFLKYPAAARAANTCNE